MGRKDKPSVKSKKPAPLPSGEEEINFLDYFKNIKLPYVLLILFLIFGFYLRAYHVQYPLIGYHNWKSAHHFSEARNFAREGFFAHGFFVPMRDTLESTTEPPGGEHYDTFPLTSAIAGAAFWAFGPDLAVGRYVNIFFGLLTILAVYLLLREIFEKEDIALTGAFLAAINPLYVFFSHNMMMENPGIFLIAFGLYLYVRWIRSGLDKKRFLGLYAAVFCIMLASITKYTFAVAAIPVLFIFPYNRFFRLGKKAILPVLISLIILSGFPVWFYYSEVYVKQNIYGREFSQEFIAGTTIGTLIDFSIIASEDFWQIMASYVSDNFTLIGALFMLFGAGLLSYFSVRKASKAYPAFNIAWLIGAGALALSVIALPFARILTLKTGFIFLIYFTTAGLFAAVFDMAAKKYIPPLKFLFGYGSILAIISYMFVMGYKMSGHNYHQFPLSVFVIMLMSYFISVVSSAISGFIKKGSRAKMLVSAAVAAGMIFVIPLPGNSLVSESMESKDRMFDSQYPGIDIAGEYISQLALSGERFFHSSGQGFGIVWHADRKGYKSPGSVPYFIEAEERFNVSWVFAYQWGFQSYCLFGAPCNQQQAEVGGYLRENYRPVQLGFIVNNNQAQPLYMLFRKGGTYNESELNNLLQNKQTYIKTYYNSKGTYEIRYINIE